jgi:hypothetical protein
MPEWNLRLHLTPRTLKVLAEDPLGDVLRARLPSRPGHPRALLTLLEGLALWSGEPLTAAISAAGKLDSSFDRDLFGGGFYPPESDLVRYRTLPVRGHRQIEGLGDFRAMYLSANREDRP